MRLKLSLAVLFGLFLPILLLKLASVSQPVYAQPYPPTPTVTPTPTAGPCAGPSNRANGCSCVVNNQCNSFNCQGGVCQPPPPTPTPTPGTCQAPQNRPPGCGCTTNNQCNSNLCQGGICQPPPPDVCSAPTERADNCSCTTNGQCASFNCSGGVCRPPSTCTDPTDRPAGCSCTAGTECNSQNCSLNICQPATTPTPIPGLCTDPFNRPNRCACTDNSQCQSNSCVLNECVPQVTPAPGGCSNTTNKPDACACTQSWQCNSNNCTGGTCGPVFTPTPTPGICGDPNNRPPTCSCTQGTQCNSGSCTSNTCNYPQYSIAGQVFVDANSDGWKQQTEATYTDTSSKIEIHSGSDPSCSSSTLLQTITSTTGNYFFSARPDGGSGTYTVCYISLPTGYLPTYPKGSIPQTYIVTIGENCLTDIARGSFCQLGSVKSLNFGINNRNPWWQCRGTDCRFDESPGVFNPIPSAASVACGGPNASVPASGANPGIIFAGDTQPFFSVGNASSTKWVVGGTNYPETFTPVTQGVIRTSTSAIQNIVRQSSITARNLSDICADLNNCTLPSSAAQLPNGIYTLTGDVHINTSTLPTGKNYVFLIYGSLFIDGDIIVPTTSTASFIISGSITVNKNVGETDITSSNPNIEGFYSTDRNFIIDGTNDCSVGADKKLNIRGSVVVNAAYTGSTFQNKRNLCDGDFTCPVWTVTTRPDFLLYAPDLIKHQNFTWQEITP